MYKLLAVDLDGTLLDSNSALPEINARYIRAARDMGVHVAICSGRSLNPLEYYCRMTGIFGQGCYAVGYNGGLVFETQSRKLLRDVRLSRGVMLDVVSEMMKFDVDIIMYVLDRLIAVSDTETIRNYMRISMTPIDYIKDFSEVGQDVSKVLAIGEKEELLSLERHMLELSRVEGAGCGYNMFLTGPNLFEVSAIGADKGSGMAFLAGHLGIGLDEVVACGDYYNDIQMIKAAGLGVAVANAESSVKAVADYITHADNNQGAVAEVIQKFFLGQSAGGRSYF